jgi:hypothetical protein
MTIEFASTLMVASAFTRMTSTSTAGFARRILSMATNDWPPAITRASPPCSCRAEVISSTVSARM